MKTFITDKNCSDKYTIIRLDTADSTNTHLLSLARSGAAHGTVVIAREQTAGRGRRGRSFLSPAGGLYMSVLLRQLPYDDCSVMTAAAAVAFRRALQSFSDETIGIKWVNDLMINGKKTAGILAEGVISADARFEGMVIGVGVNLTEPPAEVADIACALPGNITCDQAAHALLNSLDEVLDMPLEKVIDEYRQFSAAIGHRVTVVTPTGEYEALAADIDQRARLICITDDGQRTALDSGEIRIRL